MNDHEQEPLLTKTRIAAVAAVYLFIFGWVWFQSGTVIKWWPW